MPILADIPVALSAEQVVDAVGRGRIQASRAAQLMQDAGEAIATGQTLWRPMAVYEWFQVQGFDRERVLLSRSGSPVPGSANGCAAQAVLHVGPKAHLLEQAERVLISCITIGPQLEQRVAELQAGRESLRAYMLDSAGVMALGAVGEAIRCLAEETASEFGWGLSPALAPGSLVGWSLRGQQELCALLPLESIGVRLNDHCVLEPQKSASNLIGLGPGYEKMHVGSVCKYCALADTCWRRREEPT